MSIIYNADLVQLHDSDLPETSEGASIDHARGAAASQIREVVAKVLGMSDPMSFSYWQYMPCKTELNTIGVVDIASGCAFDSGQKAPGETDALGYVQSDNVVAGANNSAADVDCIITGEDGKKENIGRAASTKMPLGWQQIVLPTWRGYHGNGRCTVPEEVWRERIAPTRFVVGLGTCYGRPSWPHRLLENGFSQPYYPVYDDRRAWEYPNQERVDKLIADALKSIQTIVGDRGDSTDPYWMDHYATHGSIPSLRLGRYYEALSPGMDLEVEGLHSIHQRMQHKLMSRFMPALDGLYPHDEGHLDRWDRDHAIAALMHIDVGGVRNQINPVLRALDNALLAELVSSGPSYQPKKLAIVGLDEMKQFGEDDAFRLYS